ncbi:MAG: CDP-glycerol glycerophosphotransferase family protein [Desulfoarculaceae bacterium]|nr:CDP-glycerol glycerophosphotransferase family protein [Desulfoarculaceae bacterium]
MFNAISDFLHALREWRKFKALPGKKRALVVYSEGQVYWPHFEPLIDFLWQEHQQEVVYLTSDKHDPVLYQPVPGVTPFYIGFGSVRTLAFAVMKATIVLMTMPDLQTYYIKRSPHVKEYVYVHHAMMSCHMAYLPAAFDHFDTILSTGPYQIDEIRAREKQVGLPAKNLIEHGYGRLEALIKELASVSRPQSGARDQPCVLVAPSWGKNALLDRLGSDFLEPLLSAGFHVILRPHPQTWRIQRPMLESINVRYKAYENFTLEDNVASKESLLKADVMISDWSGAPLEFAFARLKPVLFVDVPRKVNNPGYENIGIEPFEARVRESLGAAVTEADAGNMVEAIQAVLKDQDKWEERIRAIRDTSVYNLGKSGSVGAKALMERLAVYQG